MSKEKKWTPHIITTAAFVVFIVLGLACASTPKPPTGLSQAEMRLDDPRMPPDRYDREGNLTWYWLGTQTPELSIDQMSIFCVSRFVNNLRIDGRVITLPRFGYYCEYYLYLPPGRHTITVSYREIRRITIPRSSTVGDITINFQGINKEIVMEPQKHYGIYAIVDNISSANAFTGGRTVSSSLVIDEWPVRDPGDSSWKRFGSYTPPALKEANSKKYPIKYLEPYDSSLPLEKQAFFEIQDDINIVGFNGDDVFWGWNDGHLVIGVPEGRHTLQIVRDKIPYTMTLDCLAGSRYFLYFYSNDYSEGGINANNVTGSASTNITRATENLGVLALYDIPAQYNGKYAFFHGEIPRKGDLNGYRSRTQQEMSLVQIRDGKVNLPLRITNRSGIQGYYGNDTASGHLFIYNTPTVTTSTIENIIAAVSFSSIRFSNGNASKSVNDGTLLTE